MCVRTFMRATLVELRVEAGQSASCLLYTSDAADERSSVDLGGRRNIKKKKYTKKKKTIKKTNNSFTHTHAQHRSTVIMLVNTTVKE